MSQKIRETCGRSQTLLQSQQLILSDSLSFVHVCMSSSLPHHSVSRVRIQKQRWAPNINYFVSHSWSPNVGCLCQEVMTRHKYSYIHINTDTEHWSHDSQTDVSADLDDRDSLTYWIVHLQPPGRVGSVLSRCLADVMMPLIVTRTGKQLQSVFMVSVPFIQFSFFSPDMLMVFLGKKVWFFPRLYLQWGLVKIRMELSFALHILDPFTDLFRFTTLCIFCAEAHKVLRIIGCQQFWTWLYVNMCMWPALIKLLTPSDIVEAFWNACPLIIPSPVVSCVSGSACCGRAVVMCLHHKQELLELFCETCDLLACSSCHLSAHKDHRWARRTRKLRHKVRKWHEWLWDWNTHSLFQVILRESLKHVAVARLSGFCFIHEINLNHLKTKILSYDLSLWFTTWSVKLSKTSEHLKSFTEKKKLWPEKKPPLWQNFSVTLQNNKKLSFL